MSAEWPAFYVRLRRLAQLLLLALVPLLYPTAGPLFRLLPPLWALFVPFVVGTFPPVRVGFGAGEGEGGSSSSSSRRLFFHQLGAEAGKNWRSLRVIIIPAFVGPLWGLAFLAFGLRLRDILQNIDVLGLPDRKLLSLVMP